MEYNIIIFIYPIAHITQENQLRSFTYHSNMRTTHQEPQIDPIEAEILDELSKTLYACSSLTRLNGGVANFVYRGILHSDGDGKKRGEDIIVKHTKDYVARSQGFKLDVERCVSSLRILLVSSGFR